MQSFIKDIVMYLFFFFNSVNIKFKENYLFFINILDGNINLSNILKKKLDNWIDFWEKEKEEILFLIEYERNLISNKYSNMKTFKDAWHIFFRHFLLPLFFLLGTAYIVGVIQHCLIGLTYEHFGYVYNGKFPFTKY